MLKLATYGPLTATVENIHTSTKTLPYLPALVNTVVTK